MARYAVGLAVARRSDATFPWGTFVINVSGCFAIGFFLTFTTERVAVSDAWRLLFPIGFVGAYTTFSTYAYETLTLVQLGAWWRAAAYVLASTLAGFGATWLAVWAARRF
jgi:CrcB protein